MFSHLRNNGRPADGEASRSGVTRAMDAIRTRASVMSERLTSWETMLDCICRATATGQEHLQESPLVEVPGGGCRPNESSPPLANHEHQHVVRREDVFVERTGR